MRNATLAKIALRFECTKNGLGRDIYEMMKKGANKAEVMEQVLKFEIPNYLRSHYWKISQYY